METIGKQNEKEIHSLIEELKQYDNEKGYRLSYKKVKKKLETTTKKVVEYGEASLEFLHPLLEHEETWSCTFALEIIRRIKSEKSILSLINFLKKNDGGDYWECYEEAMFALTDIGEPAIKPLLSEIISNFKDKKFFTYIVGALTEIKHDDVYSFMVETVQDYINHPEKYDDWFMIESFTYDFDKQGKKEILPLLKKLVSMDHLSNNEKIEIESTIEELKDPEKFERETKKIAEQFTKYEALKKEEVNEKELLEKVLDFESKKDYDSALECLAKILAVYPKSYHALFLEVRIKRKIGKPDIITLDNAFKEAKKQKASKEMLDLIEEEREKVNSLFREAQTTADEELELNFRCNDCGKRQNLKPGLIWHVEDGSRFLFENEIMCRHCFSHNLELTKDAHLDILGQQMRMMVGESTGILSIGKKVYVENKLIKFSKSYQYLLDRLKQEPLNSELYLRAANSARKQNKYEDAINHYKKAIELNPKLIAVYVNLIEIYQYRYEYYKIKEAKDEALEYLKKIRELYESQDYNAVTLQNYKDVIQFIREKEAELGISSDYRMIKEEDVEKTLKKHATIDLNSTLKNIEENIELSKSEVNKLLNENKAVLTHESCQLFDKKTGKSTILQVASAMLIDPSKLCICGSGKYLKECCFNHVVKKRPFIINTDFATYSLFNPIEKKIVTNEDFAELVDGFKDDPRFYCDEETNKKASFLYYGNSFFTLKDMGNVVFGTLNIKKRFSNKSNVEVETLSQNRFDSLYNAVKEHLDYE